MPHTPGPWLAKWNGVYGSYVVVGEHCVTVGTVAGLSPGIDSKTGKANSRLVATAPDLLEQVIAFCFTLSLRYGAFDGTDEQAHADCLAQHGAVLAEHYLALRRVARKARGEQP